MNINWFPGHMKKTIEEIENKQKLVDFVIEVVDARIPRSSRNPLFDEIIKKPRLIILNKEDLASPVDNKAWVEAIDKTEDRAILYNSNNGNPNVIVKESKILMKDFIERQKEKGISTGALRAMIVGIPNSGKSTFINNVSRRRATKVGNRPGVTKTNQWIRINDDLHLLDTPGVLWHKLDKEAQIHLAWTGAIKDEIMDIETLAFEFIKYILKLDKTILENRYKIEATDDPLEVMEDIARKRGAILRGAEVDYNKVSSIILDEFRKGILGRITLEKMIEIEKNYYDKGLDLVCGIDEVGRGCLFGDVVAAAVIMPKTRIQGVNDSKKLTELRRAELYDKILKSCVAYGIGVMDSVTIDKINIKMATHLAMLLAVQNLRTHDGKKVEPDILLIDAERLETDIQQESIVKGDEKVYSIACASIVAKVYRDRLCEKWGKEYPGYNIEKHKGYGTKEHRKLLIEKGPTPHHRKSFLKNMENWK